MILPNQICLWFISFLRLIVAISTSVNTDERNAVEFLKNLNQKSAEMASKLVSAHWKFETSHTESSAKDLFQVTLESIKNAKKRFRNVVDSYPWKSFSNPDIRRQLKMFSNLEMLALPEIEYQQFQEIVSELDLIQTNTTICDYYNKTKCDIHLIPDIERKLQTSENLGEETYLRTEWRKATEPKLKILLGKYLKLCDKAAVLNNYSNCHEFSLRNIEIENVKEEMTSLWKEIKPLYSQIHAYVRRRLREVYGKETVSQKGPIPAYLLGSISLENWSGIAQKMMPFPEYDNQNFTSTMLSEGYTPELIHQLAESFFSSMNFSIPPHLWFNDTFKASQDVKGYKCYAEIFNLYNDSVWIRDCGKVSLEDYLAAVRLVAKAQYKLQYNHQPYIYQSPADPGLEEAINNIVKMSASSFRNLKELKLYKNDINDKVRINRLFKLALEKVTAIPFLLVQEFWRWDIYSKKQKVDDTDRTIHYLREKFQGITTFSKELNFDPGGKGSVFSSLSLFHQYIGIFIEFQMYESLCRMSDSNKNNTDLVLDDCSFSKNIQAGTALKKIMELGSSKPLLETLKQTLLIDKVSGESLVKYFQPLLNWLKNETEKKGEYIGWKIENDKKNVLPRKKRRKRSLDNYKTETKEDDNQAFREPDRFQRLIHKRAKDKYEEVETNDRDAGESEDDNVDKKFEKNNNQVVDDKERNTDEIGKRAIHTQRSVTKNSKKIKEKAEDGNEDEEKDSVSVAKTRNTKRHTANPKQEYEGVKHPRTSNNREGAYQTDGEKHETDNNYGNAGIGTSNSVNTAALNNGNNNLRFVRRTRKKLKRFTGESNDKSSYWKKQEKNSYDRERPSRGALWHTDTKKDISKLLHSFGFTVESDDKDKLKELKKKLKGDTVPEIKSNTLGKDNYEALTDLKSEGGDDKGNSKVWTVKSYVDNVKYFPGGQNIEKKEESASLTSVTSDEKTVGKKETNPNNELNSVLNQDLHLTPAGDSVVRHINIDLPSLQALLKGSEFTSAIQKQLMNLAPELSDNKVKFESASIPGKTSTNKYVNYLYKCGSPGDMGLLKERKDFKDEETTNNLNNNGNKPPCIIILGQIAPDLRDKIIQEKTPIGGEFDKVQTAGVNGGEGKKNSDKKYRASEQMFILPLDFKSSSGDIISKLNNLVEHEHVPEPDLNVEVVQEGSEGSIHPVDRTFLGDDKSSIYKAVKDIPSQYIISWNGDKNRKVVKRSKREHSKETGNDNMKLLKLAAPVKDTSNLETLLSKSLENGNIDESKLKLLLGNSLLNADSKSQTSNFEDSMGLNEIPRIQSDKSGITEKQIRMSPSNGASGLPSKTYSQAAKTARQRQDLELESDNLKDNKAANAQDSKEGEMPYFVNSGLRCNNMPLKKKSNKAYAEDESKMKPDVDMAAKDDTCCKKIVLTPCPSKSTTQNTCSCPTTCPCPDDKKDYSSSCVKQEELNCKKPCECSLVNCQFKITKAKKPHERLTIMIYDRINPPTELPEPYDALAVISEILQRIQCCSNKQSCQLTEEDPDYPSNDNSDQLKNNPNQQGDTSKVKLQELSGEIPILGPSNQEDEDNDDNPQGNQQNGPNEDEKYQPKEKATPAIDQLTVFNKDKLKPVFIELRKIDDLLRKRSQQKYNSNDGA